MKWTYFFFLALVFLLGTQACTGNRSAKNRLIGHWQAVQARENERLLTVDPAEIQFRFFKDNTYAFQSTLNYREAGHYSVRSKYLITTDTLDPNAREKAVEIVRLTPDSLQLRMLEQEQERLLTLVKTGG